MKKTQIFRVNSPQVVGEMIDGEVVIVNLDKGYYYSLQKTGADVWSKIESQLDRDNIVQEMTQEYDGSFADITTAIDEFLEELLNEEIIVVTDSISESENPNLITEINTKKPFEKPILEKFTDMEDLLLLDPIHEVDIESGWPNAKSE